jgi:hypothetical protein
VNRREEALGYAASGWPVLRLHTAVDGQCTCGDPSCGSVGKHPRVRGGYKAATTDPEKIRRQDWDQANIGVRTGEGRVVVDVDPRNGGDDTLHELEREHGALPDTPTSLTGGGGFQLMMKADSFLPSATALWPGIDIKAAGGYVVAPSSMHKSGGRYEWRIHPSELDPAPLPAWIAERLTRREAVGAAAVIASGERKQRKTPNTLALIPEGARNSTLISLAGTLRNRGMSEAVILDFLLSVNRNQTMTPLEDAEIRNIAKSAAGYEAPPWLLLDPWQFAGAAVEAHGLGITERAVLAQLCAWGRGADDYRPWRSIRKLADDIGLDKDTVHTALGRLRAAGVIVPLARKRSHGTKWEIKANLPRYASPPSPIVGLIVPPSGRNGGKRRSRA